MEGRWALTYVPLGIRSRQMFVITVSSWFQPYMLLLPPSTVPSSAVTKWSPLSSGPFSKLCHVGSLKVFFSTVPPSYWWFSSWSFTTWLTDKLFLWFRHLSHLAHFPAVLVIFALFCDDVFTSLGFYIGQNWSAGKTVWNDHIVYRLGSLVQPRNTQYLFYYWSRRSLCFMRLLLCRIVTVTETDFVWNRMAATEDDYICSLGCRWPWSTWLLWMGRGNYPPPPLSFWLSCVSIFKCPAMLTVQRCYWALLKTTFAAKSWIDESQAER